MGQVKKTKAQIENDLNIIYKLRMSGNSYEYIAQKVGVSKRNFFKSYLPKLKKMIGDELPTLFDKGEMDIQDKIFMDTLNLWRSICISKAMKEKESAEWMKCALTIQVLLTRFRREGFTAFNLNEYRQITQRMGGLTEQPGADVLQAGDSTEAETEEPTV